MGFIFSLSGFKFKPHFDLGMSLDTSFGVKSYDLIASHKGFLRTTKGAQSLQISGETLPYKGDKQGALKLLYELAKSPSPLGLVNSHGDYFGAFFIIKISETRSNFNADGLFMSQSFTIDLEREGT